MHGIDADRDTLCGKLFHYRNDAGDFQFGVDSDRSGPGGLTTHIDDRRAVGSQGQAVVHGPPGIEIASAIGE